MGRKNIMISIIMARATNGAIGIANSLPWHIPDDLKRFKELTIGKPIIMGRKTYESIGKPLKRRTNIVITRQSDWREEGVIVCNNVDQALYQAKQVAERIPEKEIMVIGGAEIYSQFMKKAHRIYLTLIEGNYEGDVFFPQLDKSLWGEISRQNFSLSSPNIVKFSFIVFERRINHNLNQ